jgi:uncharacterized lipoprotein YddW (UPF0748 family)
MFKKIYTFFIIIIFILISVITVNGVLIPLQKTGDGGTLYYKGTTDPVLINSTYEYSESEFRGVWITPLAGNIPRYTSQSQNKSVMTQVFDNMEQYNLNVLIYHVRIMNDAFYDSEFNNWSSYYSTNPDWEALSWIIDEAHKRGIEFHAWMNPYRITNSYSGTVESYASSVSNKKNAASNPDNILKSGSKLILNPGEPAVRNFLVDTVEELVTNYDVDAIHFDDYFYIDGVDDSSTRAKYNPNNLGVADWRREQVDLFIHELKDYLDVYNQENNKHVELGISPSGIWQNGDGIVTYDSEGNAITTGSKTGGMEHNNNYLYSNTVNWVNHEWIDYILPQSYWGFEHPVAGFADVMGWWNKVVKYKNVNLYSGIGIYMAESSSNTYSWQNNPEEMKNMMLYLNTLENVKGFSLYSYAHLEKAINSSKSNHILFKNLFNNAYNVAWTENVLLPEKIAGPKINPGTVTNVNLINDGTRNILSWDSNSLAKYYAIYKNDGEITYDNSELFDVVLASTTEVESYSDVEASNYHYAVLPLSYSNTTGQGVEVVSDGQVTTYKVEFYDASGTVIKTQYVEENSSASAPVDPLKQGYTFTGWDKDFNIITDNLKVYPEYEINTYTVTFKINGDIISTQDIVYNNSAISPTPIEIEGYSFIKWDKDFTNVSSDLIINAVYEVKLYLIEYYDGTTLLKSEYVEHGKNGNAPLPPEKIGLDFLSWDKEFSNVTENLEIYAIYSDAIYEVKFFVDGIQEGPVQYVNHGKDAIAPEVSKPGYGFVSWDKELTNITKNTNIYAIFSDEIFQVKFFVNDKLVKTYVALYGEKIENPDVNIEGIIILTWDQEFDYITKSMNINAIYEVKTFTVIYKANDVVIKTETVEYGKDGIAPEVPIIEGYEFDKWDSNYENVTEDLLINAQYKRSIYSVIFKHNNKVISSQEVYYGENGVAPVLELQTGYKFIEWSNSFNNIKEDLIIEAIVEQEIYTVIFYDLDDNILTSVEVLAGEEAIAPNAVEINGKTFSKWDKDFDAVFEDLEIRPIYTDVIEIEDNAKCSSFNIFQVISVFMAFGLIVLFRKKY